MFSVFGKGISQLSDRRTRKFLWLSIAAAMTVIAVLWTGIGALLTAPALFEIKKAKYKSHGERAGKFDVKGRFVLGAGSNGIDLFNEDVIVTFDEYSWTIPADIFFPDDDEEDDERCAE